MSGTPLDWVRDTAGQLPQSIGDAVNQATGIAEGIIFADGSLPAGTNPADIYAWFHNGPGTAGYQQATDALAVLADVFPDYTKEITAAQQDVSSGWTGPAAQESVKSFDPLLKASAQLERHATNARASVADQVTSFNDTKNRVIPVPAQPPSGPGMKQFTQPFAPDNLSADAAVAGYQLATYNNQNAYGAYQGQTTPQGKRLPQDQATSTVTKKGGQDPPVPQPGPLPQPGPRPQPGPPPSPQPDPPRTQDQTDQQSAPPARTQSPGDTQTQHLNGVQTGQPTATNPVGPKPPPGTPSPIPPIPPATRTTPQLASPSGGPPKSTLPGGTDSFGRPAGSASGGSALGSLPGVSSGWAGSAGNAPGGKGRPGGFAGAEPYRAASGKPGGATASGRPAAAGSQGMGGAGGHGKGEDDQEHRTKFVLKTEHESELVGELPSHAPAVIEGFGDDEE
ncbi:hypothetical protein [Actinocrispum sp. NPDC049592]|uniref:hypothetical protein n=1 Tax=Actinocrispum sp. NPDC049592 TaxID=3154835 RepID=UPI00342CF79C